MWKKKGVSYFNTVNMLSYHFESSPNGRWIDLYIYLSLFITFFRILCFFQKIKTLLCRVAFVLWSPLVLPPTNPPGRVSEVHPEAVGPRMGEAWPVEHPTKSTKENTAFHQKTHKENTRAKNTSPFLEFWLSERLEILTARTFGSLGLRHHRTLEFQAFPTTTTTTRRRRRRSIFNIQEKKQRHLRMKPRNRLPARGQRLHLGESIGCALRESSALAEVSAWRAGNAPWFLQLEHQQREFHEIQVFCKSNLQFQRVASLKIKEIPAACNLEKIDSHFRIMQCYAQLITGVCNGTWYVPTSPVRLASKALSAGVSSFSTWQQPHLPSGNLQWLWWDMAPEEVSPSPPFASGLASASVFGTLADIEDIKTSSMGGIFQSSKWGSMNLVYQICPFVAAMVGQFPHLGCI